MYLYIIIFITSLIIECIEMVAFELSAVRRLHAVKNTETQTRTDSIHMEL